MFARSGIVSALCVLCIVAVGFAAAPTCTNYDAYIDAVKPCVSAECQAAVKNENAEGTFCTVFELAEEMFFGDAMSSLTAIADWDIYALKQLSSLSVFYTGRASRFNEVEPEEDSFKNNFGAQYTMAFDKEDLTAQEAIPCVAPPTTAKVCNYSWAYALKAMLDTAYTKSTGDVYDFSFDYIKNCLFVDEEVACSMDLIPADLLGNAIQTHIPKTDEFTYPSATDNGCGLGPHLGYAGEFVVHTPEQPNRGGLMNLMAAMPTMALVGVKMDQLRFTGNAVDYSVSKELRPLTEQSDQPNLFAIATGYHKFPDTDPVDDLGIERIGMWFLEARPLSCFHTYLNLPMVNSHDDGNFAGVAAYAAGLTFTMRRNPKIVEGHPLRESYDPDTYVFNVAQSTCARLDYLIMYEWFEDVNYAVSFTVAGNCMYGDASGNQTPNPPHGIPIVTLGGSGCDVDVDPWCPTNPPPTAPPTTADKETEILTCAPLIVKKNNGSINPTEETDYDANHCYCWNEADWETRDEEFYENRDYECVYTALQCPFGSYELEDPQLCIEDDTGRRLQVVDSKTATYANYLYVNTVIVDYTMDNTITKIVFNSMPNLRTVQFGESESVTAPFLNKVSSIDFGDTKGTITTLIFKGNVLGTLKTLNFDELPNLKEIHILGSSALAFLSALNLNGLKRLEKVVVRGEYALRRVKEINMVESFGSGLDTTMAIQNGAICGLSTVKMNTGADPVTQSKNHLYRLLVAGNSLPSSPNIGLQSLGKVTELDLSMLRNLQALYFLPNVQDASISHYPTSDATAVFTGDTTALSMTSLDISNGRFKTIAVNDALQRITSFAVTGLTQLQKVSIIGADSFKATQELLFTDSFKPNYATSIIEVTDSLNGADDDSTPDITIAGGHVMNMNFTRSFNKKDKIVVKGDEVRVLHFVAGTSGQFADTSKLHLIDMPMVKEFVVRGDSPFPSVTALRVSNFYDVSSGLWGLQLPPDWTSDTVFGSIDTVEYCAAGDAQVAGDLAAILETTAEGVTC